jgi:Tol biopolymer transport system component
MLWVRSLASSTAQQISGTEGALYPFWSGDSREIGFSDGGKMKRADPSTGAIEVICSAGSPFGDAWNDRGVILFAVGAAGPLYKVDASGGSPQVITKVNGEESHGWPTFLPDQNHFLYIVSNSEHHAENGTYVGSLTSMEKKQISSEIVTNMQFGSGRLFFVRDRSLMAQPFDVKRLELTGKAEIIAAQELEQDPAFSRSSFSVSDNGVVVFQSAADNFSRLTWFDRAGKELETLPATGFRDPSLSRNGSLLTVSADDQRNGKQVIRIYNFARGTSTRITNSGNEVFPQISPDGKTVAYRNTDGNSISTVAVDNSGQTKLLFVGVGSIPNDWSKDGRYLLFMDFKVGGSLLNIYDSQQGSKRSYSKIGAEAQFSPDGNWVASIGPGAGPASDNYWDTEILVTKFPNAGGRVQISNNGGAQPRWRADGKELYFIDGNKKLMAVSIDTSHGKVEAGIPHVLFQTRIIAPRVVLFQYAVSPDGNRFLINSLPSVGAAPVTVLIN